MLKISEVFYSIQGEGYWSGTPAYFVRLSGCSVGCVWCDTDYKQKESLTPETIGKLVISTPTRHVVLTGGEPTDQQLDDLVSELHRLGCYVQLETSGVRAISNGSHFDWVTVSPKMPPNLLKQIIGDECKMVFAWPVTWYIEVLKLHFRHFFLQPLEFGGKTNVEAAIEYVKQHPKWRLSLQTHKILGIR